MWIPGLLYTRFWQKPPPDATLQLDVANVNNYIVSGQILLSCYPSLRLWLSSRHLYPCFFHWFGVSWMSFSMKNPLFSFVWLVVPESPTYRRPVCKSVWDSLHWSGVHFIRIWKPNNIPINFYCFYADEDIAKPVGQINTVKETLKSVGIVHTYTWKCRRVHNPGYPLRVVIKGNVRIGFHAPASHRFWQSQYRGRITTMEQTWTG